MPLNISTTRYILKNEEGVGYSLRRIVDNKVVVLRNNPPSAGTIACMSIIKYHAECDYAIENGEWPYGIALDNSRRRH